MCNKAQPAQTAIPSGRRNAVRQRETDRERVSRTIGTGGKMGIEMKQVSIELGGTNMMDMAGLGSWNISTFGF